MKKIRIFYLKIFIFFVVKFSVYLNLGVFSQWMNGYSWYNVGRILQKGDNFLTTCLLSNPPCSY